MEQIREGVLGDGVEGNFREEGLPSCVQSKRECFHGCSGHNFLWQFVPLRNYSNAERMLAATGLTPKPNAGGGSKDCVRWKVEEAVDNSLHADKVTTDSSTD